MTMMKLQDLLEFAPEVAVARTEGRAIVALESTIISHGMPYPHNVQTAREVEAIIRAQGAVPATIAVLGGKIRIGLTDAELELLGQSPEALKISRRDLPFVIASHKIGATTVAATMIARRWRRLPCSSPVASVACTAARRPRSIFRPTCKSWRGPRWRSCAPVPSPFSTSA
jgi:pseudouridine-5'-phosphate glycosidase